MLACAAQPDDTQEIVDNLVQAGFVRDDITVVAGTVYVGRDAEVSLAASRELLQPGRRGHEQYRTTNLISPSVTKICIDGFALTGVFSTALDLAIRNYDEQPLTFAMGRGGSADCSFTINTVLVPGLVGGFTGFPSNGFPPFTISIGDGLSTFPVETIAHLITHEIGHAIGLRHSDFFNRSISCGSGGDEGDLGIGAILIPGTPGDATVGGSVMNSCFRTIETGKFTASDVTALQALYGGCAPAPALYDFDLAEPYPVLPSPDIVMTNGMTVAFRFTVPAGHTASFNIMQHSMFTTYWIPDLVQTAVSRCRGDFEVSPLCRMDGGQYSRVYTATVEDPSYCHVVPGTTYFFNVKQVQCGEPHGNCGLRAFRHF
jgi:hypothetical protein